MSWMFFLIRLITINKSSSFVKNSYYFHIQSGFGQRCPNSVPSNSYAGVFGYSCYQFVKIKLSWPSARHDCHVHGGDLVTIQNQDVQRYIEGKMKELHWTSETWIGATDRDKEGAWQWIATGIQFALLNVERVVKRKTMLHD